MDGLTFINAGYIWRKTSVNAIDLKYMKERDELPEREEYIESGIKYTCFTFSSIVAAMGRYSKASEK